MIRRPPRSTPFPSPTLSRSPQALHEPAPAHLGGRGVAEHVREGRPPRHRRAVLHAGHARDRKSTRLNSSHANISYAVFCLKKKNEEHKAQHTTTPTLGCRRV